MASLNKIWTWDGSKWYRSGIVAHTNQGVWTIYKIRYWNGSVWI